MSLAPDQRWTTMILNSCIHAKSSGRTRDGSEFYSRFSVDEVPVPQRYQGWQVSLAVLLLIRAKEQDHQHSILES